MGAYILRRLLLIIPTLFGIMVINFTLTQFVPGGPIEQIIAQIEGQGEFVQTLIDSMTAGIGAMVDADIEAASAKLQALQVQQQLGVQALSIANSNPQTLLSLFR